MNYDQIVNELWEAALTKNDNIFFDDIYMTNLYIYNKVLNFTEKHKDNKIIIGAGATKQLEPINDLTNTQS